MVGDGKYLQANQLLLPIELTVPQDFHYRGRRKYWAIDPIICQN